MFQQGVNPAVGWYVTAPEPSSPHGQRIEAAGPIYNVEGGSEVGFNTVELDGPNSSTAPSQRLIPGLRVNRERRAKLVDYAGCNGFGRACNFSAESDPRLNRLALRLFRRTVPPFC